MASVTFSSLPSSTSMTGAIIPIVQNGNNYTVTSNVLYGNVPAITATGNITASYFLGNGSQLTGLPSSYSNANVAAFLPTYNGNVGNISSTGYLFGNGSQLTGLPATYGNANVAAYLPTYTGTISGVLISNNGIAANSSITTPSLLNVYNLVGPSSGNLNIANPTGNINLESNVRVHSSGGGPTTFSVLGNIISSGYLFGNGSQLTGLYGNPQVASYLSSGTVSTDYLTTGNISATGIVYLGTDYVEKISSQTFANPYTPSISNGTIQTFTATSNFTLNAPTGMIAGQNICLIITQDGTGSRVMTPNAAYKFAGGINTLSTAAGSIDLLNIFYTGSIYLCSLIKGYV